MNKNLIIGLLVVAVVIVGGYFLMSQTGPSNNGSNPTSTVSGETPVSTSSVPDASPSPAPQPAAPAAETDRNAVPSNSSVVVTGRVYPNGAVTEYWYEYGESSALGRRTASQSLGSGFVFIPAPAYITGLKGTTTYYFRLNAKNQYGSANGATYSFKTNTNPPPQGSIPTGATVAATNIGRDAATLNGQLNPKGSEATYWFEYGNTTSLGKVTALRSAGHGTSSVNVSGAITGLAPLTQYYFRLNVQNQYGTLISTVMNFTTKGPAASAPTVTTSAATNVATSSATLNGRVNPNGAETSYWFEYSKDSNMASIIGTVSPVPSLSGSSALPVFASLTGLDRHTKYFYRVGARNSSGTVKGSITSFTTRP